METPRTPWTFLEEFRGTYFSGEWPTLPEDFRIIAKLYGERPCFTVLESERITLTYAQALEK